MNKKRIMIVDDEVAETRLLKANLELTNQYEVRVENWPQGAVEVAQQFKPDVMLLDLLMPNMPGGNVVAAFEAEPDLRNTPIIFLTAAVGKSQVEDHDGFICDHPCLAKPVSVDEIVRCIEDTLAGKIKKPPFRMNMLPREDED
jgi:CheY-like chemotaxis protein